MFKKENNENFSPINQSKECKNYKKIERKAQAIWNFFRKYKREGASFLFKIIFTYYSENIEKKRNAYV